jgi:small-conductance mechanosensitive channel
MDLQQAIYFDIHEAFEHEKVEFAYPTRKLWLATSNSELLSSAHGASA